MRHLRWCITNSAHFRKCSPYERFNSPATSNGQLSRNLADSSLLLNFRAVGGQGFPTRCLLFSRHAANDGSGTMLAFNHRVVALFKTRQSNISYNFGLHLANVSLRELIVRRIISIFDELRFRNPSPEAGAFDVDIG